MSREHHHTRRRFACHARPGVCLGLLLTYLLLPAPALGQANLTIAVAPAATAEDNSHAERCLAAIDLAVLAAESGIQDVSVEAMRRATMKGPPVAGIDLGGLLSSKPNVRANVSSQNAQPSPIASAQAKLSKRILRLHEVWKENKVDPLLAYSAFLTLVFPPQRPSEAFPYAESVLDTQRNSYSRTQYDVEEPPTESCAAVALVEWARLADKQQELLEEAKARQAYPGAVATALLVQVLMAQDESRPVEEAAALCEPLTARASLLVTGPEAMLLCGHVWKMLQRLEADAPPRQQLIDAVLVALQRETNWAANEWLLFIVAHGLRDAVDAGDEKQYRRYAEIAMSRYNSIRSNNVDYVASQEAAMNGWAARRAFAAGHLKLAADCLRAQHQLPVSQTYLQSQSDAIIDPLQPIVQALLTLDRAERYGILKGLVWKLPDVGAVRCSRLNNTEQIPRVFRAAAGEVPWRAISAENALGASLLEWTMRDAISLGKQQEVLDEITQLEKAGSDNARIARVTYDIARDQPIDLAALIKSSADPSHGLVPLMGARGQVTPLDLEILKQALSQPEFREQGLKLLDRLHSLALRRKQDLYVTLTRGFKLDVRDEPFAATHHDLAHWIVADDIKAADHVLGNPAESLWVRRDDKTWGHQFGPNFSTLMLRYPLAGDYTISFRVRDGEHAEGAASLCGRMFEFLEYRKRLQIWGVGHRNMSSLSTDVLRAGKYNDVRFERKGDTLTVRVNDEFEKKLDVPPGEFPFFGLASYHYRESSFDSLAIEGSPSIPRSVTMLDPRLIGWSGRLTDEKLITVATLPESDGPEEDERVDWRLIDGVLESVPREPEKPKKNAAEIGSYERPRRESLLQYLRPLASGEQVALEFYYEPGKVSLAPALGRIAMLLNDGKVTLHWITVEPAGVTTGLDDRNRVEDPAAEQVAKIELKKNDWNQLAMRLEGDMLVLEINGQIVYRRSWEPEAGRLVGLFHDPAETQVRVRKVELTGDWPEALPADLFELKPRAEVTSVDAGS